MFCEKCGAQLSADSVFCENCGAKNETPPAEVKPITAQKQVAVPVAKEKKPLSTKSKVIMAIVAVLAVVLGALYGVGSYLANPERIVEKAFTAMVEADYETLYDYLDVPEGEFLTKDMFVSAMTNTGEDGTDNNAAQGKISNFNIQQDMYSTSMVTLDYVIEYTLAGSADVHTMNLSLIKSGKKFIIFDDYKLGSDTYISNNTTIIVPENINVSVDGLALQDYSVVVDEYNGVQEFHYNIPMIFSGYHNVTVSGELIEEKTEQKNFDYDDNEMRISDFRLSSAVMEKLQEAGSEFLEVYLTALSAKSTDGLEEYISEDRWDLLYEIPDGPAGKNYIVDSFTWTTEYETGEYYLSYCSLNYILSYEMVRRQNPDSWFLFTSDEPEEVEYSYTVNVEFVYEDGQWVIDNFTV